MPWMKPTLTGLALCAASLAVCRGQAKTNQYPAAATTLPEMVVTATRGRRALHEAPYAGSVRETGALWLEEAVRTLPDALKTEPGIMLQRTSHGQGSPYIRGFTGYRNLMLVDGIRLNNAVFRDGPNQYWNTVDALSLSRLEIVRGPASVLYGSDAIGGTVQAFTRGEADLPPDRNWSRRVYYRHAGAENSHIARAETIGRTAEDLTVTLGYTFKSFGDLAGGRTVGAQPKTAYDERHWDAKIEYRLHDEATVTVAHQRGEIDDAWRTHSTLYGIDWEGLTVGSDLRRTLDQRRDLSYVQYRETFRFKGLEEVHAGVFRHVQAQDQDRLRTGDRWNRQGFEVETLGAFLMLSSPFRRSRLTYGIDLHRDRTDTYSRDLNPDGSVRSVGVQGPVADGAVYDMLGAYLQSETPLHDRLDLVLGGRYTHARADAPRVEDPNGDAPMSVAGDWNAAVGSARLLQGLNAQRSAILFAGISQGFRAPNLADLTHFDIARTDEFETPVRELDPEYYLSCETGIKLSTPRVSAQATYAYTFIDGMIVRTPTGRVVDGFNEVTKRNAGDGYIQSLELDLRYRLWEALSLIGGCSWMEGKVDAYPTADAVPAREYVSRLMPATGRLGLRWARPRQYWVEAACTVAERADRLSSGDRADTSRIPPGGTPGYAVFDVRAGWRVSRDFAVSMAVENVTDEDYRIHGSGINEPGRNLVLAVDGLF